MNDRYRRWSPAETARAFANWEAGLTGAALTDGLDRRDPEAVRMRLRRVNKARVLARSCRWTAEQRRKLTLWWGTMGTPIIAKRLGRSVKAVIDQARKLGLPPGVQQGFESLKDAAVRAGYYPNQVRRILQLCARVKGNMDGRFTLKPLPTVKTKRGPVRLMIDPFAVDEAIAWWIATETLEEAARRVGVSPYVLRTRAIEEGILNKTGSLRWRLDPAFADRVARERAESVTVPELARENGVSTTTIRRWLDEAGVTYPKVSRSVARIPRAAVETVIAEKVARRSGAARDVDQAAE